MGTSRSSSWSTAQVTSTSLSDNIVTSSVSGCHFIGETDAETPPDCTTTVGRRLRQRTRYDGHRATEFDRSRHQFIARTVHHNTVGVRSVGEIRPRSSRTGSLIFDRYFAISEKRRVARVYGSDRVVDVHRRQRRQTQRRGVAAVRGHLLAVGRRGGAARTRRHWGSRRRGQRSRDGAGAESVDRSLRAAEADLTLRKLPARDGGGQCRVGQTPLPGVSVWTAAAHRCFGGVLSVRVGRQVGGISDAGRSCVHADITALNISSNRESVAAAAAASVSATTRHC